MEGKRTDGFTFSRLIGIVVVLLVFGCVVIVHCLLSVSGVSYVGLISQLMLVPAETCEPRDGGWYTAHHCSLYPLVNSATQTLLTSTPPPPPPPPPPTSENIKNFCMEIIELFQCWYIIGIKSKYVWLPCCWAIGVHYQSNFDSQRKLFVPVLMSNMSNVFAFSLQPIASIMSKFIVRKNLGGILIEEGNWIIIDNDMIVWERERQKEGECLG